MVIIKYFDKKRVNEDEVENNTSQNPVSKNTEKVIQDYVNKNSKLVDDINVLKTAKAAKASDLNKEISDLIEKSSKINVSDESDMKEKNMEDLKKIRKEIIQKKREILKSDIAADTEIYNRNLEILNNEEHIIENGGGSLVSNESIKKSFGRKLYEASTNRTDEMFIMISLAFDSIDGLSYTPNDTKKRTMARNIIAFINKNVGWGSDGEYHGDEFNDEVKRILNAGQTSLAMSEKDKFVKALEDQIKNNVMFSYIFKENNQ